MDLKDVPQYVIDFIESNSNLECSLEEFFSLHSNTNHVHNATIQNLFLYFDFLKHLEKDRVVFYPHAVLIVDNRKYKFFIFDDFLFLYGLKTNIPTEFKKKFIFYSSTQQENFKSVFVESKQKEAVYSLEKVFDEQTFYEKYKDRKQSEIKKKIYNRLLYPFKYLESHKEQFKVEDVNESHLEMMEEVHREWSDFKLADPKVFKMMFSSGRYNRTIKAMFNHPFMDREDFFCKVFYWDGLPIAFRQVLVIGEYSYDIGFFSLFWKVPSNLILYINSWCLKELKDKYGVKYHNTGMLLDKNLERSKNHFPNDIKLFYKYNLI